MFPAVRRVRLHRFWDSLAVSFSAVDASGRPVKAPTFHLPAAMVEALRVHLGDFLSDYAKASFGPGSKFGTRAIDDEGRQVPD